METKKKNRQLSRNDDVVLHSFLLGINASNVLSFACSVGGGHVAFGATFAALSALMCWWMVWELRQALARK